MFGCEFRTGAGRCTAGIYMNFLTYKGKTIVVLDTEGIMNFETDNKVFDNQIATIAVLASDLIIFNTKGELKPDLAGIIGISLFAKLQIGKKFKPSILFVLRDQRELNSSNVKSQGEKLKEILIKHTTFLENTLDSLLKIDPNNVILLPSAFSSDKNPRTKIDFEWRNETFASEILVLRKEILTQLFGDCKAPHYESMINLYERIDADWQTLEMLGDGILNSKNLKEMAQRLEIERKASKLIEDHNERIIDKFEKVYDKQCENIYFDEYIMGNCFETIYKEEEINMLESYEVLSATTDNNIKNDYKKRLTSNLKQITSMFEIRLNQSIKRVKDEKNLDRFYKKTVEEVSELLKNHASIEETKDKIEQKFSEHAEKFYLKLQENYPTDSVLENKLILFYNNVINLLSGSDVLNIAPKSILTSEFTAFTSNNKSKLYKENLMNDSILQNQESNSSDFDRSKFIEWTKILFTGLMNKIEQYFENDFFINDKRMRSSLRSLCSIFYDPNHSLIIKYSENLDTTKLFRNLIFILLNEIYALIKTNRDNMKKNRQQEYEELIEKMKREIINDLYDKDDSKKLGNSFGKNLIDSMYELIFRKELEYVSKVIKKNTDKIVHSSEKLIELAYAESFKKNNYENVVKYITDTDRYCREICFDCTNNPIQEDLAHRKTQFEVNFNDFLRKCQSVSFAGKKKVKVYTYDFIEEIRKVATYYSDLLLKFKDKTINFEILKYDEFEIGFLQAFKIEFEQGAVDEKNKKFKRELDLQAHLERIKQIRTFIGCDSICPGCGSKCNLQSGHDGNHKSSFHLFGSFNAWFYESKINPFKIFSLGNKKEPMTGFCWEKARYKNKVFIGNKEYKSLERYVQECHKDWAEDLYENYLKYEITEATDATLKYKNEVIRAWMNTRSVFLTMYDLKDKSDYGTKWKKLEEKNRLPANFEVKWKYNDLKEPTTSINISQIEELFLNDISGFNLALLSII